jgi:hypothetical protein
MKGENRNWYKFFSILGYVVSGIYTLSLALTLTSGFNTLPDAIETINTVAMVIMFQVGAWFTLKEAFKIKSIVIHILPDGREEKATNYAQSITMMLALIILYLFCSAFSIFSTANQILNAANRAENVSIKNSDSYQLQLSAKSKAIIDKESKQKEKDILMSEKTRAINEQYAQLELWNDRQVSIKQGIKDKAVQIADNYDKKIKIVSDSIDNLQKDITSPILAGSGNLQQTGFGIFKLFTNAARAKIIFFILFGMGNDIIAAFCTIMYSRELYFYNVWRVGKTETIINTTPSNNPPRKKSKWFKKIKDFVHVDEKPKVQFNPKLEGATIPKNNIIDFQRKKTVHVDEKPKVKEPVELTKEKTVDEIQNSFTDNDVKNYLSVMYSTRKPSGDSRGFEKIGALCGLDRKTSEKIKGHLETIGIVKSGPGGTKILVEANNIKEA